MFYVYSWWYIEIFKCGFFFFTFLVIPQNLTSYLKIYIYIILRYKITCNYVKKDNNNLTDWVDSDLTFSRQAWEISGVPIDFVAQIDYITICIWNPVKVCLSCTIHRDTSLKEWVGYKI